MRTATWSRAVVVALVCVTLLGLAGCGMQSSWSISPVVWGEEVGGGVVVTYADEADTVEVGEEKQAVPVLAHVYFFSEDDDDDFGEPTVEGMTAAITEQTVCTLDDSEMEPAAFVEELMAAQDGGGSHKMKIVYLGGAATEVALEER